MKRCVLVVEDEPLIRMQTVAMLEAAGLQVVEFDSASEALDYTETHADSVGAIFTDVNVLGRINGIDLAAKVAKAHPGITILVTSGRFDVAPTGLPPRARFLAKPWLPLQVIQAMQDAVEV